MRFYSNTYQCKLNTEAIIKGLPGEGRKYLLIENRSLDQIYLNFGTHPDSINGISILSGGSYELDRRVSNDDIYIIGTAVTDQNINITQGYDDV